MGNGLVALYRTFPLELDCRHDDDNIRLRPRERQRDEEEEDAIDHEEDDTSYNDDSSEEVVSEGLEKQRFLPESPIVESKALSPSHDDWNATLMPTEICFFPTRQHLVRQAAPERAVRPSASMMGAK